VAGTVTINKDNWLLLEFPKDGFKESGNGKEGSKYGLKDFTQLKSIGIDTSG